MTISAGTYRIRNVQSGTYLDASLSKRGTIHGWAGREGQQNQEWEVQNAPNGRFTLRNVQLGTFATVNGQSDGTRVQAGDHPTTWEIRQENQGYSLRANGSEFVADLDWGKDENGTSVSLYRRDNRHNQQLWQFQPVSGRGSGGGYSHGQSGPPQQQNWQQQQQQQPQQGGGSQGELREGARGCFNNGLTGTRMDLARGDSRDGTKVIGYQKGNGQNQIWQLERTQGGHWKLKNCATGTYLGLASSQLDGGPHLTGQRNGAEWDLEKHDIGYVIKLANSNFAVDLEKGSARDETPILLWTKHDGQNQQWIWEPVGGGY